MCAYKMFELSGWLSNLLAVAHTTSSMMIRTSAPNFSPALYVLMSPRHTELAHATRWVSLSEFSSCSQLYLQAPETGRGRSVSTPQSEPGALTCRVTVEPSRPVRATHTRSLVEVLAPQLGLPEQSTPSARSLFSTSGHGVARSRGRALARLLALDGTRGAAGQGAGHGHLHSTMQ